MDTIKGYMDNLEKGANIYWVPFNPTNYTISVVAKVTNLNTRQSIVGNINTEAPNSITGISISVETDGSLTFVSQRNTGQTENVEVRTIRGIVKPNQYFVAHLRLHGNKVLCNYNLSSVAGKHNTDLQSANIILNSAGFYLGNHGFVVPKLKTAMVGSMIPGCSLPQFKPLYLSDESDDTLVKIRRTAVPGFPMEGKVLYIGSWCRVWSEKEISEFYRFSRTLINRP